MSATNRTHLMTDRGCAPCGVTETRHWSVRERDVTCPECRALLDLRALERNLTERRLAATIARLVGGGSPEPR